jgi:hypothetical protein
MPEKISGKEMEEKVAGTVLSPKPQALPKSEPVELLLDEADTLFGKRSDPK